MKEWSTAQELPPILRNLNQNTLPALAAASRERYETCHPPTLLAQALRGESPAPPAPRVAASEPVQRHLFEKYYLAPAAQAAFTLPVASWRQ